MHIGGAQWISIEWMNEYVHFRLCDMWPAICTSPHSMYFSYQSSTSYSGNLNTNKLWHLPLRVVFVLNDKRRSNPWGANMHIHDRSSIVVPLGAVGSTRGEWDLSVIFTIYYTLHTDCMWLKRIQPFLSGEAKFDTGFQLPLTPFWKQSGSFWKYNFPMQIRKSNNYM